jgi:NAD(P)-dependent dehydrogenase (short-subunit alcohol dehydrogenase family)
VTGEGRVVVVTGGSKGIGEGCVRAFVGAGATTVFCARGEAAGRALEAELNRAGPGKACFVAADLAKPGAAAGVVDEAVSRFGRLDCLVNNAGWHPGHRPIEGYTEQEFRDLLELNVVSIFSACRRALPELRKTKGSIVNVSSLVAQMGQLHAVTYAATKGAVTALTKALAVDEAAHDVRVNCISPGNVWTPLWRQAVEQAPDPAACKAAGDAAQALGRMGTPEEAGRLCLFLAFEATFVTGVDTILSGGAELAYGRKTRKD